MKDLARITAIYSKLDLLSEDQRPALSGGAAAKIETDQALNDQAYVVLCWGQLEIALAMRHYDARNRIAHGKLVQTRVDLVSVIRDFYLIQSALHRSA